jgi:type II secretory pathway pseudopilin PulG
MVDNQANTPVEQETTTSWKQWKLPQLNLGTLVSILIAVGFIVWQGMMIRAQIDDNSNAVADMAVAVEGLAGAVSLANELDTRTNQMFTEIENLRSQYQDSAYAWAEISTNTERAEQLRLDLDDVQWQLDDILVRAGEFYAIYDAVSTLEWKLDEVERRLNEMVGGDNADADLDWQVTDLVRQVAELHGKVNAGADLEWKFTDLENGLDWEIDELTRQLTELRVRVESGGGGVEHWQVDDLWGAHNDVYSRTEDLYHRNDEMWDMVWRLWTALETRNWSHDYLYDD